MSAVSVLVIDCTTIGAPPPTATPPTCTATVLCRIGGVVLIRWDRLNDLAKDPKVPH
jgi:hypothetical protein